MCLTLVKTNVGVEASRMIGLSISSMRDMYAYEAQYTNQGTLLQQQCNKQGKPVVSPPRRRSFGKRFEGSTTYQETFVHRSDRYLTFLKHIRLRSL